jgi:hypothetical protein
LQRAADGRWMHLDLGSTLQIGGKFFERRVGLVLD